MKIDKGTMIRTVILLLALINQVLTSLGECPLQIENTQVELLISTALTVISSLAAWWKNNSFSTQAIECDCHLKSLKKQK